MVSCRNSYSYFSKKLQTLLIIFPFPSSSAPLNSASLNSFQCPDDLFEFRFFLSFLVPKSVFSFAVVASPPLKALRPFFPIRLVSMTSSTTVAAAGDGSRSLLRRQSRRLDGQLSPDVLRNFRGTAKSGETAEWRRMDLTSLLTINVLG